jgi:hypothetical protein
MCCCFCVVLSQLAIELAVVVAKGVPEVVRVAVLHRSHIHRPIEAICSEVSVSCSKDRLCDLRS